MASSTSKRALFLRCARLQCYFLVILTFLCVKEARCVPASKINLSFMRSMRVTQAIIVWCMWIQAEISSNIAIHWVQSATQYSLLKVLAIYCSCKGYQCWLLVLSLLGKFNTICQSGSQLVRFIEWNIGDLISIPVFWLLEFQTLSKAELCNGRWRVCNSSLNNTVCNKHW